MTSDRVENFTTTDGLAGEEAPVDLPATTQRDVMFSSYHDLVTAEGRIRMPFTSFSEPRVIVLPAALRRDDDHYDLYMSAQERIDASGVSASRDSMRLGTTSFALAPLPARATWEPPIKNHAPGVPFAWSVADHVPAGVTAISALIGDDAVATVSLEATPAWAGAAGDITISNPAGVPGWKAAWDVDSSASWSIGTYTRNGDDITSANLNGTVASSWRAVQGTQSPQHAGEQRARLRQRLLR